MSAKDWFHHVTHDIKHAGDHAGDAIKHGAEDTGKGIADQGKDIAHGDFNKAGHDAKHDASSASTHARHSADAIGKDVEDAIVTTLNDVQNLWNKAKHDLESAEHAALGSLEAKRKEAWNSLNAMKHSVSHDLEVLEDGAKAQLSKTGAALKHDLDDIGASYKQLGQDLNSDLKKSGAAIKADIESATDTAIKKLTSEAMVHGLSEADKVVKALHADMEKLEAKLPKLVDALNNIGNSIELGPIQLNYASFYSRAEELSDALDKALEMVKAGDFKLTQTFFNDLVKGLGPDSLTINAEIEFFSRFGLDLKNISMDLFTEIADFILDELGVPKGDDE